MEEKDKAADDEQNPYLEAGSSGPPVWLLLMGGVAACLAFVAVFYGLYTINRDSSPTLTPAPQELTQAAMTAAAEPTPAPHDLSASLSPSSALTMTPALDVTLTPLPTMTMTVTDQSPTYTVQQGDTLQGIE